ncbi:GGDEF domain-containing protein [Deinococcus arcticus]|uniref:GGDEF domain-containing protein n=1 Tax=Deinococcus arcticus TaxID=2136176 RepID=A0A2T3W954_9DEIO|nr:GGDEF domain-containing protein [Deinococcus arcticus]PTA68324.1 hypothetical protein C8263_07725 [Deinococcus arcticus]
MASSLPSPAQLQSAPPLIVQVAGAPTCEAIAEQVLRGVPGLRGVAVWGEGGTLVLASAGERPAEPHEAPVPLTEDAEYWLSTAPPTPLPPELLAVIDLRLRYLEARRSIERLSGRLSSMATAATTDPLTRLPNRMALDADLQQLDAEGAPFAVVFIDLDGFKAINDQHGHAMGDSLLKGYGLWLSRVTGPWGRVYRMGGDEYLLLVTHFPGSNEAFEAWAHERLPTLFVDGVTASIGIAWRHERPAICEVLKLADQRMYQAKTAQARAAGR